MRTLDQYFFQRLEHAAMAHATAEPAFVDYMAGVIRGMREAGLVMGYSVDALDKAEANGRHRCRNHVKAG